MHKAILSVALSLNTKNNVICALSFVKGFCRKKTFDPSLKHLKSCHGNESVSCDQALDKLSEKLNRRLLVQEEHGFQKAAQCVPWPHEQKKAWPG